jgi:hypothetical protein
VKTVSKGAEVGNPLKHQSMVPTAKDSMVCHWNQYGPDVFTWPKSMWLWCLLEEIKHTDITWWKVLAALRMVQYLPPHRVQHVLVSVSHMRIGMVMSHDNIYKHPTLLSLDGGTRRILEWSYVLVVVSGSFSSIKALNGHKFRSGKDLYKCHINFLKTQLCHCKVTHIITKQK